MKIFSLGLFLVLCLNLIYCTENKEVVKEKAEKSQAVRLPDESGELALLMRDIAGDSEKMREDLEAGKIPEDLRKKWKKIHSSAPTKPTMIDGAFPGLVTNFLVKADDIYKPESTKEMRIRAFHLTLDACISCHENYCPGPISRIRKLYLLKK